MEYKENKVLKHWFELMLHKSEKNIVVLWDEDIYFENVADDIKKEIKDEKVVSYPNKQCKEEGVSNVKQFVEKCDHILVTQFEYFNGCECENVIVLTSGNPGGVRNGVLRGVQNLICVQLIHGHGLTMKGMKEDNRFLWKIQWNLKFWEWEWFWEWFIIPDM